MENDLRVTKEENEFSILLQHVNSLLGNDRETSNYARAIAKYWLRKQACFHGNQKTQQ
jgi:hypothetical protein